MCKKYLIFFITILLIGLATAQLETFGTFKQNQAIRISQVCSDATYINISSVSYPNSSVAVSGIEMTSAGNGEVYYDFNSATALGRYDVRGISDGCENTFAFYFDVTPSGFYWTTGFYILILILSVGIIILGYYVQDAWVVVLGSFGLILIGLFILFYGIVNVRDTAYTWGLGIITLMLGTYFGVKGTFENLSVEL